MLLYLVHFLVIMSLSVWLWQSAKDSALRPFFWLGLLLKILAGLALGWIYLRFYNQPNPVFPDVEKIFFRGDSWSYFAHGKTITQLAPKDWHIYFDWLFQNDYFVYERFNRTGYNNNHRAIFMYRITHIFNFLTANNYWLISIYFSFFSFFGLWRCADVISRIFPTSKYAVGIGFFLFPSVVFWSAGILKETLLVGALGLIISILLKLHYFKTINKLSKVQFLKYGTTLGVCFWMILRLKYYYFAVLMPVLVAYFVAYCVGRRFAVKNWTEVSLFFGMMFVFLGLASFLHQNLNLSKILNIIVQNYEEMHAVTGLENQINFPDLKPDFQSFMINTPKAFWEGLMRPYPWESGSFTKIPVRLENLFLYLLLMANLCFFIQKPKLYFNNMNLLLITILTFSGILLILMTFATPNIGTLIRYKVGFMPFLVCILSLQPTLWLERKMRLFFGQ